MELSKNKTGCNFCITLLLGMHMLFHMLPDFAFSQYPHCRTPGARKTLIFEPAEFNKGPNFGGALAVHDTQGYKPITVIRQINIPNPNPDMEKGLIKFIEEMQYTNIGLLYLHTHGFPGSDTTQPGIVLEFYQNDSAWSAAFGAYIDSGYCDSLLFTGVTVPDSVPPSDTIKYYGIGLSSYGIDYYCNNLEESLVYIDACHSSTFDTAWEALAAIGYADFGVVNPDTILVISEDMDLTDSFFAMITGLYERLFWTNSNKYREVNDAANQCKKLANIGNEIVLTQLVCTGEKVVLSPIVIDHYPRTMQEFEPGTEGYVIFDCEMDYENVAAQHVVELVGISPELTGVTWNSPYAIKFTLPTILPGYYEPCVIGFQVDPDSARSRHNKSKLDGNYNPYDKNGVGPNGDPYTWLCTGERVPIQGFMDFEDGVDGQPIHMDTLGWIFEPSEDDDWQYCDRRTGNYQLPPVSTFYWCDGNFFAGIPFTDAYGIRFVGATVSSVCLGASTHSEWLYLTALDSTATYVIDRDSIPRNSETLTLSTLSVDGDRIGYAVVHGAHNQFLIDDLVVYGLAEETGSSLDEGYYPLIQKFEVLNWEGEEQFPFTIPEYAESLQVFVNAMPEDMPEEGLHVTIYDNDQQVADKNISELPFQSEVFDNPEDNWEIIVSAEKVQEGNCAISVIAATYNSPRVDCYVENNVDIWWYPSTPDYGDDIYIYAQVHCDDELEYSLGVEYVKVRCYLNGVGGDQIDNDEYAMNLEPGGVDTVYYVFDTSDCEQEEDCYIYIEVDPDEQLDEYYENNNVAYKEIVFNE